MTHRIVQILRVALLALLAVAIRLAPVEAEDLGSAFTYQGYLVHQLQPANGQFDFEFRLYDAAVGGTPAGPAVAKTLQVTAGQFTTILDLNNVFFEGQKWWLEIKVKPNGGAGALQTLAPRTEMTAVPNALTANNLKLPWSRVVNTAGTLIDLTNNGVGQPLKLRANVVAPNAVIRINSDGNGSGMQVSSGCEPPEAAVKVFNEGKGMAFFSENKASRPKDRAPDISPEQFAGGMSESYAAASPNVIGDLKSAGGTGWIPPGIGSIVIGDIGGWGYGLDSVGVIGQCPNGVGVFGTSDSLNGLTNPNPSAVGVRGYSAAGVGVSGETVNGSAVRGKALSGSGYAGYFEGAVQVVGNLVAGSKQFLIDHPLDPDHRRLAHASIESAEMLNLYRGNVTLDADGFAVVTLPAWFEALNGDFSYQLTPIGRAEPGLYVAEEIHQSKFRIGGGSPGARVSWMVTGVRHDRYAREHPLQVEQIKSEPAFTLGVSGAKGARP